jgi:hypothetical protein
VTGECKAGIEDHFARIGVSGDDVPRIRNHLQENGFSDAQIEGALGGMTRIVYGMRSEGEGFELDLRVRGYFENELGLTNEQIELVEGLARRIVYRMRSSGRVRGEG